jgi:hypothetical protein
LPLTEFGDLERVLERSTVGAITTTVFASIGRQWRASRFVAAAAGWRRALLERSPADRWRFAAIVTGAFALTETVVSPMVPLRAASAIPPLLWLVGVAMAVVTYRWAEVLDIAWRHRRARR